jgi:LysR family transcriptional regulator, nod-box dependent transcriptional activator
MINLRNVDLNLLVTLDALLRERNVTRAGQRLALSQPAMSDRLSRLRDLFKDELLVRIGHRLELTPVAEQLEQPLRECIQSIQAVIDQKRTFDPKQEERAFTITATDIVSMLVMPPLLQRLAAQSPGISVRFTTTMPDSIDLLATDVIDFFIMAAQFPSNLPREHLFSDRWICAASAGNDRVNERVTREQYESLPHLVTFMRPQPDIYSFADDFVYRMNVPRRIIGATANFLLAPFMLQGTDALLLLQERFARRIEHAAQIKLLEPPFEIPPVEFDLVWNPKHQNDAPHVWLRALLRDITAKL